MANSSSGAKATRLSAGQRDNTGLADRQKSFIAEAGKILASSLDYQKTLATVADLMVPGLADWCLIYILDEDGSPRLLAVSQSDPKKSKEAWDLDRAFPIAMNKSGGTASVVQSKAPVLVADRVPEMLAARARSPEHLNAMLKMGMCSLLIVPLIARDRVLGTLTLAMSESGVHYNEADQAFAMELATRAAVAIDNARLYREAQEAIAKKDEALTLLHAVLQQMPAGVVIAEAPGGNVILRNQVATEFGCGKSALSHELETSGDHFQALQPDGRLFDNEEWPLVRALQTGEVRVGEEFEIVKVSGERRFVRTNSAPIRDRDGKIIAAAIAFEDVTKRRLADRALRESEEKFRSLAEVAPCSIFIHDGEHLLYVNRSTCEITGFTREELLSKTIWDVLHPDSVPLVRGRIRRRSDGQPVPARFEERILCKSGAERWIDFNGGLIQYDGKPAVICVALDITERRHMDEQLRCSQERVRLASESAGISSWEWDIRNNAVIWSPEVYRIFGSPYDAAAGMSFDHFLARIHDDDRHSVREAIERAVSEHKDFVAEFRVQRGDGEYGWAYSRAKIFYDDGGQPERMVGVAIDITGDKIAETALRESEERFRATFNQAAVGMCQVAADGTLLMVNQKLAEILGYNKEELVGKKFHEFTHPDDLNISLEKFDAMLAGQFSAYTLEKRYLRPDGSQLWGQVTVSLVRDGQGDAKYMVAVIEDITERRRAAEALRNSERLAATGRLAASIAHEINNPLEAVTNLLYLLDQNKSLDDAARGYATMAQEEVSRVAHIARQTLGFYRDSTRIEAVQVSRLVDEVVSLFAPKLRTNEIDLRKELESDEPIDAFPGELRQVFSNLLANALDAVGKKGKLRIRIGPARSRRNRAQRGVRVTIADNGPGISHEVVERIFEPFFTTKGAKGTGLGLWVTRGIIEKHSGVIRVWSSTREGKSGTVFSVFLPLKQKAETIRRHMLSQVS
jgi:PAS domain S-box-containing protein